MSTVEVVEEEQMAVVVGESVPSLENCLNIDDIERAAEKLLKPKAYAYYASAGDDEKSKQSQSNASLSSFHLISPLPASRHYSAKYWNHDSFDQVRFRPRALRDVKNVDTRIDILGVSSTMPFFVAPAAMAKLAHTDGELCFSRAARAAGIPYIVCTSLTDSSPIQSSDAWY